MKRPRGRPKKFKEKTVAISFRIPTTVFENLKLMEFATGIFYTNLMSDCLEKHLYRKAEKYGAIRKKLVEIANEKKREKR